jgi:putative Holliday junction resolvase
MQYLGIDWGKSKIGLATGSDETRIASPFKLVKYQDIEELLTDLKEIIKTEQIDTLIIGKPVQITGKKKLTKDFLQFVEILKQLKVPIELEDERLSTKAAQQLMKGRKTKLSDDVVAAMLILQAYLDRKLLKKS